MWIRLQPHYYVATAKFESFIIECSRLCIFYNDTEYFGPWTFPALWTFLSFLAKEGPKTEMFYVVVKSAQLLNLLVGDQTTEFHLNAILHIASYTNGVTVGFPIQFAYQPKATPIAGEACETNRSNGKLLEDLRNSSVALFAFAAISQVSTWLRGIAWASAKQWR